MNNIYKLNNKIKHYEWGSSKILPQFLNMENKKNLPFAEMWMGTHKSGSSQVADDTGNFVNLSEVSGDMPFLLKLLAVEKPLSIQAHPNKEQAQEGFNKEESAALSLTAPKRNYKDTNHKPEILCALTPFKMMAGFREPEKIKYSLEEFLTIAPQLKDIISPLIKTLVSGQLSGFFRTLFNFTEYEMEYLCSFINGMNENISNKIISNEQCNLMKSFCAVYPGDPAILSPLYLNYLELNPGQAVYIPAGILHAYLSGFGVELMTNSDNVLRGGLTHKHIDISELLNILYFVPFVPQVITPPESASWYCYHTPCDEFQLAYMRGEGNEETFPGNTPAICIVTDGELKAGNKTFKKGESFFINKDSSGEALRAEPFSFCGNFQLFAACTSSAPKYNGKRKSLSG
ncbi:MAG: mannose-6-phosphate isomerase, class I [Treponema sp.]|nr:mannose-6-phosphate isomerase, class I [Treponema sp.]